MKKLVLVISLLLLVLVAFSQASHRAQARSEEGPFVGPGSNSVFLPLVSQIARESDDGVWKLVRKESAIGLQAQQPILPDQHATVALNDQALATILKHAPLEFTVPLADNDVELSLPLPDGRFLHVKLYESPIMAPELAARYPQIKTYTGQGIEDPAATARIDWTPQGFHAQILFPDRAIYVDPLEMSDANGYISYDKRDLKSDETFFEPEAAALAPQLMPAAVADSGDELRTYRLAMAATAEYTALNGGTVANALAAIVTTVNRVNGIYEREVSVRLALIADNDDIIFTDAATDGYTNGNASLMADENQTIVDDEIGSGDYDIGHVLGTRAAGNSGISKGNACNNGNKAAGATASVNPTGVRFDVDFVAHEIGHHFNADHTWNGSLGSCASAGQYIASNAYEPGSGSTIMAYAGICGTDDIQNFSDPYFHTASYDQIIAFTTAGGGSSCATVTSTGNGVPTANAGSDYIIPVDTPFVLTGSGSDPDGDALTYNWEEFDLGTQGPPSNSTSPPYFRSWPAVNETSRILPRLVDLVNNTTDIGEVLPTVADDLTFRLTVRDNRAGGGGVDHDSMQVTVSDAAGPFRVTSPNINLTWQVTGSETVTWDVASSDAAPVNCANVDLLLSLDGGFTYPVSLVAGTPNDGSQSIVVPDNPVSTARVKVACADNIFFDISDQNFTIIPLADAGGPYTTDEGVDQTLDGTGSSTADLYEWDLDNDGFYDDATGPNPTFDLVGQDGVYTVGLRVTRNGLTDTDTTTVTVNNVAPSVTVASDAPVDENAVVTISGQVSDPGWLELLTATVDWGDGTPAEPIAGDLENARPDATLTFTTTHIYGDNGLFAAEVCGYDDDTSDCKTLNLQIDNVAPTAEIDMSGAVDINGVPTFLAEAGEVIDFSGHITDPGSDDIIARWDWADGSPVEMTTYLVNPPDPDPFPSPSIQPRAITDDKTHMFGDACMYEIDFWAEDDDGGVSAVDSAMVMIVGTSDRARHAGYWQHQYGRQGYTDFDDATLLCYLQITDHVSTVFNEERDASTIPAAYDVLFLGQNEGSELQKFDRRLLTVWLNVADGSLDYLGQYDSDNDGLPDDSLANIVAAAEAARLNPVVTSRELQAWRQVLTLLINQ